MTRVAIAAGGTAGHVVPALAVAAALRERGAEVEFLGGERAEAELVPAAGYPFHPLRVAGLDRRNPLKAARALAWAGGAARRAGRILRAIDAVAERLGNTRAVCRKYYVHPELLRAYLMGETVPLPEAPGRGVDRRRQPAAALRRDEIAVLQFLQERISRAAE